MSKPFESNQTFSLEKTVEQVNKLEQMINDLRIYTRRLDFYPFDTVAGELIAKAFALSRSAIGLIQQGYPDEAFGLCRSIYEISIYLRYVTSDRDRCAKRSIDFLEFGVTSKAFWMELLEKSSSITEEDREDIHRYKLENKIPDDPKRITQPWSGVWRMIEKVSKDPHPIDPDSSTPEMREKDKAIAYTDSSSYVHCTQPGVNSYAYEQYEPILIRKETSATDTAIKTAMVIQFHLREIIRYSLFGMNVLSLADMRAKERTDQTFSEQSSVRSPNNDSNG